MTTLTPSRKHKLSSPESRQDKEKIVKMSDTNPECGVFKIDDFNVKFPPLTQPENPQSQSNIVKADALPCLCGVRRPKPVKIKCGTCDRVWHGRCVGLKGATVHLLNKLESNGWVCPKCFVFSDEVIAAFKAESVDIESEKIDKVGLMIQKEINAVIPKVVAGVEEKIMNGCLENVFKDAGRVVSNSWAEIARTDQNKIIEEAVQATSDVALQQSMKLLDSNLSERKKRSRNVIITNIPENSVGTSLGEVICSKIGEGLTRDDILSCNRLGKPGERSRAILCVLRKEDDAVYLSNNGKGRKFPGGVWINPDLTRAERDVLFEKREARRERNSKKTATSVRESADHNMETDVRTISAEVHVEPDVQNEDSRQSQQPTDMASPAALEEPAPATDDVSNEHLNQDTVAESGASK